MTKNNVFAEHTQICAKAWAIFVKVTFLQFIAVVIVNHPLLEMLS